MRDLASITGRGAEGLLPRQNPEALLQDSAHHIVNGEEDAPVDVPQEAELTINPTRLPTGRASVPMPLAQDREAVLGERRTARTGYCGVGETSLHSRHSLPPGVYLLSELTHGPYCCIIITVQEGTAAP